MWKEDNCEALVEVITKRRVFSYLSNQTRKPQFKPNSLDPQTLKNLMWTREHIPLADFNCQRGGPLLLGYPVFNTCLILIFFS